MTRISVAGNMVQKNLDRLSLLVWKNFLLQIRHPWQTIVEILGPVVFCALLVLIRSLVDPEPFPDGYSYPPYEPSHNLTIARTTNIFRSDNPTNIAGKLCIPWSPCNDQLRKVMGKFEKNIKVFTTECYSDSNSLQNLLETNTITNFAGIEFPDYMTDPKRNLDANVSIALRFPGELRVQDMQIQNWRTNRLFPLYPTSGPRMYNSNESAMPNYDAEIFLLIQMEVTYAVIEALDESFVRPRVFLQRYPYPAWINDDLLPALKTFVGLILMCSFVITGTYTVKAITNEKETQIKEAMKIMGLPNWLHWTAWFVKSFSVLLLTTILIVILLKTTWYPNTDSAVLTLSSTTVIFILLLLYICATITLCFAISVFFSNANTAATLAGLIWFLLYFPYMFTNDSYEKLNLLQKILICLGSNSAIAYAFNLIIQFEGTGEGLQWDNLWRTTSPDDTFVVGHVMLMLVFDTFLYLCVALYVEGVHPGKYGVPQKWYFPFTTAYWCGASRNGVVEDATQKEQSGANPEIYEREPTNLPVGVQIKRLRKVYANKKVAVRDLCLNMYEGQITVLLGHNGAGKTTTMSMLTGMFPPTSGTASVNGYDIRSKMAKVRESLGLCPQYNIIFNELTVEEHLYFFSRLKGLPKGEIKAEIRKYVELLELVPKKRAKAATLSGGMKRKLCVGIALCGNSKIVLLDEPTAGVDPAARRALWDLLQNQKKDRTILLSTHFMDEADLLGDRIAIMAGGQLQCCGSSFFLKKKYGAGYHLIMDKAAGCDVKQITSLLREHIPNIKVENNVGSELTYLLNEDQSPLFERMLQDLENKGESLGVRSFGISLTTLEEVFMKVGADHGQEESNDKLENGDAVHPGDEELSRHSSDMNLNLDAVRLLSGVPLRRNQVFAMILKRCLSTYRTIILALIQILVPVIFIVMAMLVARNIDTNKDLPSLPITLDSYEDPITVVSGSPKNIYYDNFVKVVEGERKRLTNLKDTNLTQMILKKTAENVPLFRRRYIIGATFAEDNSVTAWFNNEPYHSPPLALEYALNSIVATALGPRHQVHISNKPLSYTLDTKFANLQRGGSLGFQLAFNVGFSMAFVSAFYIIFHIKERVSNAKHLQFVSGIDVITFWGVSYAWDLLTFIFTSLCLLVTILLYQEDGYNTFPDLARIFSVFLYFGFCVLPFTYLASFLFKIPATGYTYMAMFNMFAGIMTFMVVQVLSLKELELDYVAEPLHWLFLVLPHYSLCTGLRDLNAVYSRHTLCTTFIDTCIDFGEKNGNQTLFNSKTCKEWACKKFEQCCNLNLDYYSWTEPGIGRNVVFSVTVGCVLIAALLLIEYGVFGYLAYRLIERFVKRHTVDESNEDGDVLEEKNKIRSMTMDEIENHTLVLKDVTKYYKHFLAVDRLCLGVNKYECFGLLGVNGAGKTTTFKMMTGDVRLTSGDIWINGMSLKNDMKSIYKLTGYCPQFDALLENLTGRETLIMFALIRGFARKESKVIAVKLAKEFDFYRHIDKKVQEYSGGNKRKLSTAVSLIGEPQVIYLDEPTTGMDPATKRHIWNNINRIRDNGKCVILTSHSMEECEALCTRLAIMVNGRFKCIGSTQHLKNKFSDGYTLTIKMRKKDDGDVNTDPVEKFVKDKFPSAILREKYQELMTYYISSTAVRWSEMFGIMERGKSAFNIEDYSLGQCSLEQVFLLFTKNQRQD